MEMEKVLELVFKNTEGDKKILTVAEPRADVTAAQASEAIAAIIAANVFETSGGGLAEAVEARVRTT